MNKLYLFLFTIIFFTWTYSPYNRSEGLFTVGNILVLFVIFLCILGFLLKKKLYDTKYYIDLVALYLMLSLIILLIISGMRSPIGFNAVIPLLMITILIYSMFMLIISIHNWRIDRCVNNLAYFSLVFGVIAAIVGNVVYWYSNINIGIISIGMSEYYSRAYSWFSNANVFANMLSISILSNFYLLNQITKKRQKYLLIITLILLAITLLLTGSKAGISTLLIGILFYIFRVQDYRITKLLSSKYLYIVLLIGLSVFFVFTNMIDFDYFIETILRLDNTEERRFELWFLGIDAFVSGNVFDIMLGQGHDSYKYNTGHSTHNTYIELTVDYGLIFIIVMISILIYTSFKFNRHLKENSKSTNAYIQSLLIMIIYCSIFTTVLFTMRYEYYVLVFLISVITFAKGTREKSYS